MHLNKYEQYSAVNQTHHTTFRAEFSRQHDAEAGNVEFVFVKLHKMERGSSDS